MKSTVFTNLASRVVWLNAPYYVNYPTCIIEIVLSYKWLFLVF